MIRPAFLLVVILLAIPLHAQEKALRVPFRSVNGLILIDAKVNDNAAKLVLDTGSASTIITPKMVGELQLENHSLGEQANEPGFLGLAKHMRADVKLADGARFSVVVSVMSLDDAGKHIGAR
jgi:hypothetical protein